jgi:pyruvate dehydrogenase E2 component (dihydrolipoamide acetyltransferase)
MAELGLRLTITDLLISDVAATLPAFPELNACFSADGIQLWSSVNIALAVALPDGLSAPVIRGADKLKLPEISAVRAGLIDRARAGKSTSKDLNDATFTVSNLGTSRVDFFTAILTTGQSSILSMGRIRERLVVMQPTALVEPYATFVLTIDHRVTDGAVGAAFLEALATRIEAHATDGDLPSTPRDGDV